MPWAEGWIVYGALLFAGLIVGLLLRFLLTLIVVGTAGPGKRSERAVEVAEVPKLLEAGWEFIASLNGSMAVLKAPPP